MWWMVNVVALLRQLEETPVDRYSFLCLNIPAHSDMQFGFARNIMFEAVDQSVER